MYADIKQDVWLNAQATVFADRADRCANTDTQHETTQMHEENNFHYMQQSVWFEFYNSSSSLLL